VQLRPLGAATAALVLVACGGGNGANANANTDATADADADADAGPYVEAVAESLVDDDEEFPFDEGSATCMATVVVELIGVDALSEAGVSPEDFVAADSLADGDVELPDDAVGGLAEGLAGCDLAEPIQELLVEELGTELGGELPSDAITCLEEAIDDQAVGEAVAAALIDGTSEGVQVMATDAVVGCPDVMTAVLVSGAADPVGPEDEACIRDVIEANPDLVRSTFFDEGSTASQELGTLIVDACPGFTG
jgi:hypothetical protein